MEDLVDFFLSTDSRLSSSFLNASFSLDTMQGPEVDILWVQRGDGEDQGSERFTERIGAEKSQGCSAPLRSGAAISNP
jgi:hypothetical protein